ncbi:hypothetical protein ABKV19_007320 [Rosa sericea]
MTSKGFVGTAAIVIKHGDDSNCTNGDDNNSISIVVVTKAYLVECNLDSSVHVGGFQWRSPLGINYRLTAYRIW